MSPRLEACYFDAGDGRWRRLARALEWSARQHCPDWAIHVQRLAEDLPATRHGVRSHQANTQKLDHWVAAVDAAPLGTRLLLVDADVLVLRPLDDLWADSFDLAYTTKPADARFPFNGGVLAVRVSETVRQVLHVWSDENRRMLRDQAHHRAWSARFGGINQASFGCLLTRGVLQPLAVRELPCAEWNCEDHTWTAFDPRRTRILHIKSSLRHACWSILKPRREWQPLVDLWRAADREAHRATLGATA